MCKRSCKCADRSFILVTEFKPLLCNASSAAFNEDSDGLCPGVMVMFGRHGCFSWKERGGGGFRIYRLLLYFKSFHVESKSIHAPIPHSFGKLGAKKRKTALSLDRVLTSSRHSTASTTHPVNLSSGLQIKLHREVAGCKRSG